MITSKQSRSKIWWPREYISWSQFEKWEQGPNSYLRNYCPESCRSCGTLLWRPDWKSGRCYACDQPVLSEWTNPAMQIGIRMAEMLESDEPQWDPMLEHYRNILPKYPHREFAITQEFAGIKFAGKLDGWDPKTMTIGEYKTGVSWSQKRADTHRQLDFYQMLIMLLYGKLAERIRLHWMPTKFNVGTMLPELTGKVQTFETMRTKQDAMRMAADAIKARTDMGKVCGALRMPTSYPQK